MNIEHIEATLVGIKPDQHVCVVRPGFGSQSDSWGGKLETSRNHGDTIIFQFVASGAAFCMLFTAEDVTSIGSLSNDPNTPVIRLKGPWDYQQSPKELFPTDC